MKWLALSPMLAVGLLSLPAHALPLEAPAGWDSSQKDQALVLTPTDLGEGHFYTVVVIPPANPVGSVRGLLDAGKASLGETGTFSPAREPARGSNEQGWEFEVLIGPLEKNGKVLFAQVLGLKKGDQEGIILVIADSVETLTRYSDPFTAMIKTMGASKAAPAPAPAGANVDLKYRVPEGWTTKQLEGAVLLEQSVNTMYDKYTFRVLILPSQPLQGALKTTFLATWAANVTPALQTQIVPLPFLRRLRSGASVAYDTDTGAKTKEGADLNGGLIVLAQGTRYVPILVFFYGGVLAGQLETDLNTLVESAVIPNAGTARVALFAAGDLVGDWSSSSAEYANYVTSSGSYAGDASIATGEYLTLNADRSFKRSFFGVTSRQVVREKSEGTWSLDDAKLWQTGKDKVFYSVLAVGSDAKAGSFLVIGEYSNTEAIAKLCNPRGAFQGTWYKRKQ